MTTTTTERLALKESLDNLILVGIAEWELEHNNHQHNETKASAIAPHLVDMIGQEAIREQTRAEMNEMN